MGLSGINTVFRYVAFLAGAVTFGFDMYMIYLYQRTPNMFFDWTFYGQTGLIGCLLMVLFLSEIFYRIGNYYRGYRAAHYSNGFSNQVEEGTRHFPGVREEDSSPDSATFAAPYTAPSQPYYPPTRKEIVERRRTGFKICLSFIRFFIVIGLAAAILRITIMVFIHSRRGAFTLAFNRSSPEAAHMNPDDDSDDFDNVNPRNLFYCPAEDRSWSRPLTYLCIMDQITVQLATLVAGLVLIEAVLTVILENRSSKKANGGHLPTMLKRDEVYVPPLRMDHLGNEALAATSTVHEATHIQKSLPPLPPPLPSRQQEEEEDIPQAFAYIPDHPEEGDDDEDEVLRKKSAWVTPHTSPLMVLDEKSKTMRPLSSAAHNSNGNNYANQAPPDHEYDAAFGSSSSNAGPSSSNAGPSSSNAGPSSSNAGPSTWYPNHQNDGTS